MAIENFPNIKHNFPFAHGHKSWLIKKAPKNTTAGPQS